MQTHGETDRVLRDGVRDEQGERAEEVVLHLRVRVVDLTLDEVRLRQWSMRPLKATPYVKLVDVETIAQPLAEGAQRHGRHRERQM